MGAATPAKQISARKQCFLGFCSKAVVDTLFYNESWNWDEKMKILEKAKLIAKSKNRFRVYLEDFAEACKH